MPHQLRRPAVAATAELVLAGAGFGADGLTVRALKALRSCRAVLLLHVPEEAARALRLELPGAEDLSALHHRAGERGDGAVRARVALELGKGGRVGVVIAGHPLLYSPGLELSAAARALGGRVRVLPGVSALDGALAAVAPLLSAAEREACSSGVILCDPDALAGPRPPVDRRRTALVMNLSRPPAARLRKALERLRKAYGPRWSGFLVRLGEGEGARRVPLSALAGPFEGDVSLLVPARGEGR